MPRGSVVTNAVLLEKLNNQSERQKELFNKVDKLESKLTQNFESMSHVLQEGYVKKEDLDPIKEKIMRFENITVPAIHNEISKRLHKDTFKPYQYVGLTVASLVVSGIVYLFGRMILEFLKGGPPL